MIKNQIIAYSAKKQSFNFLLKLKLWSSLNVKTVFIK